MLELIDEGLESLLRATIPLSATDVDVAFEAPERDWSAKLTRPTVNLFLWDIRVSSEASRSGMRTTRVDGQMTHQLAFPVLELRYVVSAWTTDLGDERGLLAGVLRAILSNPVVSREFLPEGLATIDPPRVSLARTGEDHIDVFKALEGQLKPGLNLVLTTEFDTGAGRPAGPPVGSIGTSLGRMNGTANSAPENRRRVAGEVVDADERGAVGAVVRSPSDATTVNARGQFLLRAEEGDQIVLETDPEAVAIVGPKGGVRL